jgi:hypothetical protein
MPWLRRGSGDVRAGCGCSELDEVSVGVSQVAALLGAVVIQRLGQELGSALVPLPLHGRNVGDPGVHERRDSIEVLGRVIVSSGLSSVGPPPLLITSQPLWKRSMADECSHRTVAPTTSR